MLVLSTELVYINILGLQSTKQTPLFTAENQRRALTGESTALLAFTNDLYGCNDPQLRDKRFVKNFKI